MHVQNCFKNALLANEKVHMVNILFGVLINQYNNQSSSVVNQNFERDEFRLHFYNFDYCSEFARTNCSAINATQIKKGSGGNKTTIQGAGSKQSQPGFRSDECGKFCTREYKPICSEDGKEIAGNSCKLANKNCRRQKQGQQPLKGKPCNN